MNFKRYIKDKAVALVLFGASLILSASVLIAFSVNIYALIVVFAVLTMAFASAVFYDFYRRKKYYDAFLSHLLALDKKYLVTDTIDKPSFYDGEIMHDALYEIDKATNEYVKEHQKSLNDFKDYIEMWVHEVKLPLSALHLMAHNSSSLSADKLTGQLRRMDDDLERVLYFVRSENAEKDYIITKTPLNRVVSEVALKNKDTLLGNGITLTAENLGIQVMTDPKWLSFIVNQIVSNSVKYIRRGTEPHIMISAEESEEAVELKIRDNGIGIPARDISRIFDKSFTGCNGRLRGASTGMGLYIVRKLCSKLGHSVSAASVQNEYTEIKITFYKHDFFNVADS